MANNKKNPRQEVLIKAGLSPEEAEIYLDLLEHGAETATQVSSHTSVKRTYVYRLMDGLRAKNLVSEVKEGRTTRFEPNSPDHLLSLVEAKKAEASQAEREVESVLDQLKLTYSSVESKPAVQVFEGYEGLKKVFNDTIKQENEIFALVEASEVEPNFRQWLETDYLPRRVKKRNFAYVILASGAYVEEYRKRDKQALREVYTVAKDKYPISMEVNIYGNKVAFMNYKKGEQPIGFIMEHKIMAKTLKAWFDLAWGKVKKN